MIAQTVRQNTLLEWKPQPEALNKSRAKSHPLANIEAGVFLLPLSLSFFFPTKKIKYQMNVMLRKGPRERFPHKRNSVSNILGGRNMDRLSGVAEVKLLVI